jgi:lysophospholipase L1-like esterase
VVRTGVAVSIGVVVLVVGLVIGDRATSRTGDSVAIVGDSITALNAGPINQDLGPAYHVQIAATSGMRTDQMMQAAQELAATHPKQALINLGTNDVEQGTSIDAADANLQKMVSMFSTADCVHVVTINTHMLNSSGHAPTGADQLNARILQLPKQFKNVDVIRWDQTISDNVAEHPPAGDLTIDTVHPNKQGVQELLKDYQAAFDGCDRPWPFS